MKANDRKDIWLQQIDAALEEFRRTTAADAAHDEWRNSIKTATASVSRYRGHGKSETEMALPKPAEAVDAKTSDWSRCATLLYAAVNRVARGSRYEELCRNVLNESRSNPYFAAQQIFGIAQALRADVAAGYLEGLGELIHGEVFGDFLEMASHLLEEGYKDAAAVIAGSSLEQHLRQMCTKAGIDVDANGPATPRPKKADALNGELGSQAVYSKLDQKTVTAWLDLRNKAAHGRYDDYVIDQVRLMVDGVRDFVRRHPA